MGLWPRRQHWRIYILQTSCDVVLPQRRGDAEDIMFIKVAEVFYRVVAETQNLLFFKVAVVYYRRGVERQRIVFIKVAEVFLLIG
jgi:hypothetical protein